MAARLNPKNDQRARDAIQTTQLCKRLNGFALGENDPCYPDKPLIMSDTQVRAALGLLRKTIPDLAVTTISGDQDAPLQYVVRVPAVIESQSDWLQHANNWRARRAPPLLDSD